jgi:hypothetical protein
MDVVVVVVVGTGCIQSATGTNISRNKTQYPIIPNQHRSVTSIVDAVYACTPNAAAVIRSSESLPTTTTAVVVVTVLVGDDDATTGTVTAGVVASTCVVGMEEWWFASWVVSVGALGCLCTDGVLLPEGDNDDAAAVSRSWWWLVVVVVVVSGTTDDDRAASSKTPQQNSVNMAVPINNNGPTNTFPVLANAKGNDKDPPPTIVDHILMRAEWIVPCR